jgi:hypothetical protein
MKLASDNTKVVIVSALINKKHPQAIFFEALFRRLISKKIRYPNNKPKIPTSAYKVKTWPVLPNVNSLFNAL